MLTVGSVLTTNVSQISLCQLLLRATLKVRLDLASFSGLPRFCSSVCVRTEAEEREKRGRPGNTYHVNDVRWTRGGCRGGGVRIQIHGIT